MDSSKFGDFVLCTTKDENMCSHLRDDTLCLCFCLLTSNNCLFLHKNIYLKSQETLLVILREFSVDHYAFCNLLSQDSQRAKTISRINVNSDDKII